MICAIIAHMTTNTIDAGDVRIVPEWELCDRLRRSLRLVDLSNEEVAHFMGVRRETVSTWLTGRRKPSYAILRIWSDMTGVDLDWLLYGIRDSNPEPADYEPTSLAPVVSLADRVKPGLTLNRRTPDLTARRLRSVS